MTRFFDPFCELIVGTQKVSLSRLSPVSICKNQQQSICKRIEAEGIGHRRVSGIVGVDVIPGIELRADMVGVRRIALNRVEVNDRIESATVSDPGVDLLPRGFPVRSGQPYALLWSESRAHDFEVIHVGTSDELLIARDEIVSS